jgi:ATP-dependent Clp protease ATP-binding subunit ClpC
MFERFTEWARQVVVLGQDEARTLEHGYIGTEHLLLGLLRVEQGLAAHALGTLGITEEAARAQVAAIVGRGTGVTTGQIPFTRRAKEVLELALREALALGHNYIGTEHILLGMVRENEGVGAQVLHDLGADADTVRGAVMPLLSGPSLGARAGRVAAQLVIACPTCATPIETVTTDRPNTTFEVSAAGDRTCPGCGQAWKVSYNVSWEARGPTPPR